MAWEAVVVDQNRMRRPKNEKRKELGLVFHFALFPFLFHRRHSDSDSSASPCASSRLLALRIRLWNFRV